MAYQNVGTPRFYVSVLQWLKSLGKIDIMVSEPVGGIGKDFEIGANKHEALSLLDLNPSNTKVGEDLPDGTYEVVRYTTDDPIASYIFGNNGFGLLLNHNFKSAQASFLIKEHAGNYFGNQDVQELSVNCTDDNYLNYRVPYYDGWSLWTAYDIDDLSTENTIKLVTRGFGGNYGDVKLKLGCFALGNYYDVPHSPDLKLTMTRELDGVKRIRTKGGVDLVSHKYTKPAMWEDAGAWELYSGTPTNNQLLSRSGRRIWDLSFSYLQDRDMFPDVSALRNYETQGWVGYNIPGGTLLKGDDFYANVIHKTNGGQLPFIFQPDSNNLNADQFAICKFDMKEFKFEQVANGIYNINLKIREVW